MPNFNRVCELIVGKPGENGQKITDNRIAFKVLKTDTPETNSLAISAYNLSPSTRALLETTENRVLLSCGYSDEVVYQVAVGNITFGKTEYMHPDVITSAECGDGLVSLRDSRSTLSYASSVPVKKVVEDIAKDMGLKVKGTNANLSGSYVSGWAYAGPSRMALQQVTDRFQLEWSVQSEEIQITDRRKPYTEDAILINQSTGMIGSPERLDNVGKNLTGDKEEPGYKVIHLLLPQIEPGMKVSIESRDIEAYFRVKTVEHAGDTRGTEWYTTLELIEI